MWNKQVVIAAIIVQSPVIQAQNAVQPEILKKFIANPAASILPDFSYAGYAYGERAIPDVKGKIYDVTQYGATPNDNTDDSPAIQRAVDDAGKHGGGVVYFPAGRFNVNMDSTKADIIRINYSNIVMRGSGSGADGTVIFSGSATTQPADKSPWLSPFVFHTGINLQSTSHFFAIDSLPMYSKIAKDVTKGDDVVYLSKTRGLTDGDVIAVVMRNTTDGGDLIHDLMQPLEFEPFQTSYIEAGVNRRPSFQYFMEIDKVLSDKAVKLKQPMRRDILTKYAAFVTIVPMLRNIGVENFRFECAYKGGYAHHKTTTHDYGWGAVCLQRVSHGWIRNLYISNYVQNTHLINSRNVTITDITMTGNEGHYGPKMYHSSDNLVENITVDTKNTHGPGLEGCSFGNVYRKIALKYPSPVDFHGIADVGFCPPMYNLYEEISNVSWVTGGGSPENIPHSGEYNTMWGLEMKGFDDGGFTELFSSWIWRDPIQFKNKFHIDCHKQYLRTIVVGVHNPDKTLSIEHKTNNRADEWIYVEGLNKDMKLPSLYETQLKMRLKR